MAKHARIDYTLPAKDILWQCLDKASRHLLYKRKFRMPEDVVEDLRMDICVTACYKVLRDLHTWNTQYPFSNFVYWIVWSISGHALQKLCADRKFALEHTCNFESRPNPDSDETIGDIIDNSHRLDYKTKQPTVRPISKLKNPLAVKQRIDNVMQDDYMRYVGDCEEFGVEPVSFETFRGQYGELPLPADIDKWKQSTARAYIRSIKDKLMKFAEKIESPA